MSENLSNFVVNVSSFEKRLKLLEEHRSSDECHFSCKRVYVTYLIIMIVIFNLIMFADFHGVLDAAFDISQLQFTLKTFKSALSFGSVTNYSTIPIYYINLEKSVERRTYITTHLKEMKLEARHVIAFTPLDVQQRVNLNLKSIAATSSDQEIACIASHLTAVHRAVHDTEFFPNSKYALIIEDDVQFEFNIDFLALIDSAPRNFSVLQLMTSNADKARVMFDTYSQQVMTLKYGGAAAQNKLRAWKSDDNSVLQKGGGSLEEEIMIFREVSPWKEHKMGEDLWSTQAYIINKEAVRPYIDSVVTIGPDNQQPPQYSVEIKMPHGVKRMMKLFPYKIVADIYLYIALGKTYTSRIPLLNGGARTGYVSNIPRVSKGTTPEVDSSNDRSFQALHAIINEIYEDPGADRRPSFLYLRQNRELQFGADRTVHNKTTTIKTN